MVQINWKQFYRSVFALVVPLAIQNYKWLKDVTRDMEGIKASET